MIKKLKLLAYLAFFIPCSIKAQKIQKLPDSKLPQGISLYKDDKSLVVKNGYTFKQIGPQSGEVIENGTNTRRVAVNCSCQSTDTHGSCDLSTIVVDGQIVVTCGGSCSGGCNGSVTPLPEPKNNLAMPYGSKKMPTKVLIGNWEVIKN